MPMPLSVIILCVSIKRFRCESRKPNGRLRLSQTYFGQGGCEAEVACMKVEANNPTNANVEADGKRAFEMLLSELPKMAMPGVFLEIAAHSAARVKEHCHTIQPA